MVPPSRCSSRRAEKADVVIVSTNLDETNLAIAGTVKTMSDAFTIARVQKLTYLKTWQRSHAAFGVETDDHVVLFVREESMDVVLDLL